MPTPLEASIHIDASPAAVWALVSDLPRMAQWSPQVQKVLTRRPIRLGTHMLNVNRSGKMWWPTSAKVVEFQPNERIAFRVLENKMVWSYTLEPEGDGTKLTNRRDAPDGTTALSLALIKRGFGGEPKFEHILLKGMNETLTRIKKTVEH